MLKTIVKGVFQKFGFSVSRTQQGGGLDSEYDLEPEARECIQKIREFTMLPFPRLVTLYQQAVYCEKNNIAGGFAECGVWKGGAVALMALANLKHGKQRRHLHLFDVFDDICEPDEALDGPRALQDVKELANSALSMTGALRPVKGIYDSLGGAGTLEGNRKLLEQIVGYEADYLHYHKGWFQETLPKDAAGLGPLAILRLDGDWYASTKVCLDYLFDKVTSGGFVVLDDYGYYEGCKRAVDDFFRARRQLVYLHHVDKACRYLVKN